MIDRDYFCRSSTGTPLFSVQEFKRRCTFTRSVYEKIRNSICASNPFFTQRRDAALRHGATLDQKVVAALLQLSSGVAADQMVSYVRLHGSTVLPCLKEFARTVVHEFEEEYLPRPTPSEITRSRLTMLSFAFPAPWIAQAGNGPTALWYGMGNSSVKKENICYAWK